MRWLVDQCGVTALPEGSLNAIAVVVITLILSYFTLVFGELVPKRLAMKKTEGVARGYLRRGFCPVGGVSSRYLASLQDHQRHPAAAAH